MANGITATHRNGQTFLVWQEVDDQTGYHVYRHDAPITSDNLGSAERLTDRWGPLDQNTSVNRYGSADVPANFVISDSGQPLGNDRGLFVHTTQNNQQGSVYYAVTSVVGGDESRTIVAGANATSRSVNESVSTPRPVLTASTNGAADVSTRNTWITRSGIRLSMAMLSTSRLRCRQITTVRVPTR